MLCNGARLFRAFLCLVAQRKGMVINMKKYLTPYCELTDINAKDIIQASYDSFRAAGQVANGDLDNDPDIDIINWK